MESLPKYSFLPWLRQGISNRITEADKLGVSPGGGMAKERPELEVSLTLNTQEIRKTVKIHGPGDIIGISHDAIVRAHPKPETKDFESNALAYIEFYEEDFPWRFTPATHADDVKRLRPWLALVVLKEGEYEFNNSGTTGLPVLSIKSEFASRVLPPHTETWAWAHVHINHSLDKNDLKTSLETELEVNPDIAYSRLICPRRLERATEGEGGIKYQAFLIPAFETGRLAGLGEDPGNTYAQQSAWEENGAAVSNVRPFNFPVYYNWEFQTGPYGDFETLVSILKAQPLGDRFGKRDMSIEKPGYGLDGMAKSKTLGLEGALIPPGFSRDAWPNGNKDSAFREKLRDILNASSDLQDASGTQVIKNPFFDSTSPEVFYSEDMAEDPIVTPPIYAKWQALVSRIPQSGGKSWIKKLNLDPRNRAAAAVGSRIVMSGQEKYMEMAWQQVGEINEANKKIAEAELAKMVNNSYHEKRLARFDTDKLLMITAPTQKFVLNPSTAATFADDFTNSKIPNAVKSAAFKKIIRSGRKNLKLMNKKGYEESIPEPFQAGLLAKFNGSGATELTTAKMKIMPVMAIGIESITSTINCFLDLQATEADTDETLRLDETAKTTQEEYRDDFQKLTIQLPAAKFATVLPAIANLDVFSSTLFGQINPLVTMKNLMKALIFTGDSVMQEVKPIMAYPEFPEPMFMELQKVSQDFIVPNISEVPENTITLLENNQMFIEAFMAGLNHEMSRELLWREFPTDQRGSYFRNFWDDKDDLAEHSDHDILPIHKWDDQLGKHNERLSNGSLKKDFVVLLIRGDVLKKYPNTLVFAQKAIYGTPKSGPRKLSDINNPDNVSSPVFQAELDPDIALFGFNLTEEEVRGNDSANDAGWFFVLQERPGQINFGLDDNIDPDPLINTITIPQENAASWNDLSWGHLVPANGNLDNLHFISTEYVRADATDPDWGTNSAEMASILYQNPVIFARHAEEMLP